jgi:N-acetylglucosaminyldiphosphoundecaprenol N-acetyl-beta-D-mannosaminyltransferase
MPRLLREAAQIGTPVGLYGASPIALKRLQEALVRRIPDIKIAYAFSPPFSPLTPEEDARIVEEINRSGTKLLFVGLSSPKQDRWMAQRRDKIHAVMVGVGAAFDFLSGTKPQAPRWMMGIGLEWLFRLLTEPRRLWKRYLKHNPRFVAYFTLQLLGVKRYVLQPE